MAIGSWKAALHPLCCTLKHICACAQEAKRLLQADLDARDAMIRALQSQVEDVSSPTTSAPTPGLLKPTATWLADQALDALSHPLLSSKGAAANILPLCYHFILVGKSCISIQRLAELLALTEITDKMVGLIPVVSTALDNAPALRAMLRSSWLSI